MTTENQERAKVFIEKLITRKVRSAARNPGRVNIRQSVLFSEVFPHRKRITEGLTNLLETMLKSYGFEIYPVQGGYMTRAELKDLVIDDNLFKAIGGAAKVVFGDRRGLLEEATKTETQVLTELFAQLNATDKSTVLALVRSLAKA